MPDEPSVFDKYDAAVVAWIQADYANLYTASDNQTVQVLIATPDRQFSDVVTNKPVDNRTLAVPRIMIFRGDHFNDPSRHNAGNVRKVATTPDGRGYVSLGFPAPVNIPYQIGFWTDKVWTANRWNAKLEYQFRSQYKRPPLKITVDTNWGDKLFQLFKTGTTNNSELETETTSRRIRYEHSFNLLGWVFDQPPIQPNTIVPAVFKFDVDTVDNSTDPPTVLDSTAQPEENQ
jgi:hypothetical protein